MPYKDREKQREYQRINYKKWYAENGRNRADNYTECIFEWQQEHPERVRASNQLYYAVKTGKITKPINCEECGRETRLSGHHEDYLKPLEIIWLCSSCHKIKHLMVNRIKEYDNVDMAIKTEPNRNELIVKLRDKGMKFEEIGQWLGISRQRAHIIYHKQKALSAPHADANSASSTNTSTNSTATNTH